MREQLPLGLDDVAPTPRRRQRRAFHAEHVHMTVEEAQAGEKRAGAQDAAILELLRAEALASAEMNLPPCRWTPSEVHETFRQWPITSIRRALTNMTNRGLLVHYPADRRMGPLGSKESTWGIA